MKRVFSSPVVALLFGLCLRLLFVLKFPASSGDTILYEQIATNWLKDGVYAMNVGGAIQSVDLRMPGYPAYLALVYWLTGRTGDAARVAIMLGQVAADLVGCLLIAALARVLVEGFVPDGTVRRTGLIALWLAALCPFTANYTAVPLTEVFAVALSAVASILLIAAIRRVDQPDFRLSGSHASVRRSLEFTILGAGFVTGLGTLFRPETPLLLVAGLAVILALLIFRKKWSRVAWTVLAAAFGCFAMLLPWGVRNQVTLNKVQFLSPKNSNLPGELVPAGFMAWEKTWLFRVKDCYLAPWKLNEEAIDVDALPARAFDSPQEKQRVARILEPYNTDLTLTAEEDAAFAEIARERTARHPLRTYVAIPGLRAVVLWFTPRIELLPVSGDVFPLRQAWEDDKLDQSVTVGLFLLNVFYVAIGLWGGWKLWRTGQVARYVVTFFFVFVLLRTAFLTTLETPEPRYVLECFPLLIALGALALATPASAAAVSALPAARDES